MTVLNATRTPAPKPRSAAAALAAGLTVALAALALAPSPAGAVHWTPAPARGSGPPRPCPAASSRLAPSRAFTLIFRLQRTWDAETLGRMRADSTASLPLRNRDIFMVRSRTANAAWGRDMVDHLTNPDWLSGEQLGCNRITSLTGAATSPAVADEYFNTLANDPRVWSVAPDWERPMFRLAYPDTAGPDAIDPESEWTHDFATNVGRLRFRAAAIHAAGKQAGVVATGAHARDSWDFGQLAKQAGLDHSIVQIQGDCLRSPQSFADRARQLLRQYRNAGRSTSNLAVEVSFSSNPGATSLPADVTPERAARCTAMAYRVGVRSVLLWAQPDVLGAYFAALPDSIRG